MAVKDAAAVNDGAVEDAVVSHFYWFVHLREIQFQYIVASAAHCHQLAREILTSDQRYQQRIQCHRISKLYQKIIVVWTQIPSWITRL